MQVKEDWHVLKHLLAACVGVGVGLFGCVCVCIVVCEFVCV